MEVLVGLELKFGRNSRKVAPPSAGRWNVEEIQSLARGAEPIKMSPRSRRMERCNLFVKPGLGHFLEVL